MDSEKITIIATATRSVVARRSTSSTGRILDSRPTSRNVTTRQRTDSTMATTPRTRSTHEYQGVLALADEPAGVVVGSAGATPPPGTVVPGTVVPGADVVGDGSAAAPAARGAKAAARSAGSGLSELAVATPSHDTARGDTEATIARAAAS